jgi:hypothetical protein
VPYQPHCVTVWKNIEGDVRGIASLFALALIAPDSHHAHWRSQLPGFGCWRATASARLKYASAFFWIWRERLECDFPSGAMHLGLAPFFLRPWKIPPRAFPGAFLTTFNSDQIAEVKTRALGSKIRSDGAQFRDESLPPSEVWKWLEDLEDGGKRTVAHIGDRHHFRDGATLNHAVILQFLEQSFHSGPYHHDRWDGKYHAP